MKHWWVATASVLLWLAWNATSDSPGLEKNTKSQIEKKDINELPHHVKFKFFYKGTESAVVEEIKNLEKLPTFPKETKVLCYVHDSIPRTNRLEDTGAIKIKQALLNTQDPVDLIILVDWTNIIQQNKMENLNSAKIATSVVAQELFKVLDKLKAKGVLSSKISLVGHGAGAHICGQTGKLYLNKTGELVSGILGLDPLGGLFKNKAALKYKLRKGDAKIVKAIHTDKIYGIYERIGDIDEFPDVNRFCNRKIENPYCLHLAAKRLYLSRLKNETSRPNNINPTSPAIILIIDGSRSMKENERFKTLRISSSRIISSLPINTIISVIEFGETAEVLLPPIKIINNDIKQAAISALPKKPSSKKTSIGAGLEAALSVMNTSKEMKCAHITLITDGIENHAPYLKEVSKKLGNESCSKVHSIAFGDQADKGLEEISKNTGGDISSVSDRKSSENLWKAEWDSIYKFLSSPSRPYRLPVKLFDLNDKESLPVTLIVDSSILKNNHWTLSHNNSAELQPYLVSPSGKTYDRSAFEVNDVLKTLELLIPQAEVGTYKLSFKPPKNITNSRKKRDVSAPDYIIIFVTAELTNTSFSPIVLEPQLTSNILDYTVPGNVSILARLTRGDDIIINADVKAFITSPDENDVRITDLWDNGVGADEIKGDGIYSRFLTEPLKILGGGLPYEVNVIAEGRKGTKVGPALDDKTMQEMELFEREATAGFVRPVNNYTEPLPYPVRDLKVHGVDVEAQTVNLSWTATGLLLDDGTALSYLLTATTTPFFEERIPENEETIEVSSLPSGTLLSFTYKVPEKLWNSSLLKSLEEVFPLLYFKVQAEGWDGSYSGDSNIASTDGYFMSSLSDPPDDNYGVEENLFSIFGGVVLFAGLGVAPCWIWRRKNARGSYEVTNLEEVEQDEEEID